MYTIQPCNPLSTAAEPAKYASFDGSRPSTTSHVPHHTHIHILLSRAYSLPRPRNCNFAHANRSDCPHNLLELQALHPAQPLTLILYCSDFTLTLLHTVRSLDHRNPTGAQHATSARSWFLIVCCIDSTHASFPYAPGSCTLSHTLSLDSYFRPTTGKSSKPAGLSPLVDSVRSRQRASPYTYFSFTHKFPERALTYRGYVSFSDICGAWFGFGSGLGWYNYDDRSDGKKWKR
jgi:hypothetical protein